MVIVCCQKPKENCSVCLLCLLRSTRMTTWGHLDGGQPSPEGTPAKPPRWPPLHGDFSQDSPADGWGAGEEPRHPWECLKEAPGSTERKVIKVILASASHCFHQSGQGMALGSFIFPKCCQRHGRCLCYPPGPHRGRVHFVIVLFSEPVLTGRESVVLGSGPTQAHFHSCKYTSSE